MVKLCTQQTIYRYSVSGKFSSLHTSVNLLVIVGSNTHKHQNMLMKIQD